MSIRIESKELAAILTDLERTAERGYSGSGILLHSARGPFGDEPGQHPLLVGTSYGSGGVGHAHTGCSGAMEPMLWPMSGVEMVLNMLTKVGKGKRDHAVVIDRHGDEITVSEDPDLFSHGASVNFTVSDLAAFSHTVWYSLEPLPESAREIDEDQVRLRVHAANLKPFERVASRRGMPMRCWHYGRQLLVEIGPHYRGAIGTLPVDEMTTDQPDVPIYVPELPVTADDETRPDRLLADAAGLVIHLQQARPELLTRRLRVSTARAALLLRQLEARDIVGAPVGRSAVRDVITSRGARQAVADRIEAEIADHHGQRPQPAPQMTLSGEDGGDE